MAQKRSYDTLQAGRAFAAILVVLFHTSSTIFEDPKFWNASVFGGLFNWGHAGVHFFFVLSGFIILSAHRNDIGRPERLGLYAWRRVSRVYPAYWAVLIPVVAIYLAVPSISKPELTAHSVVANSFLLVGLNNQASLAVAWTLFHEILFYAFFGLCIFNRRLGVAAMSAWLILCLILKIFGVETSYHLSSLNLLFAFGMGAFYIARKNILPSPRLCAAAGAIAFIAVGLVEIATGWTEGLVYGACAMLVVAGLASAEALKPIKVPALLKLLGDASYSIYLVHYPALSVIARVWRRFMPNMPVELAFAGVVAAAIFAGVVFHFIVERPLIARLRDMSFRRSETAPA
jgi:exopolysaccharide production protein ExoZ